MRNKIIAFIFIIPILLILLIFGVSKAIGNTVQIPVRGIALHNTEGKNKDLKENRIFDTDQQKEFKMFVNVIPANAKNKNIDVEIENLDPKNKVEATVKKMQGGYSIEFRGTGKVKISCMTKEGGYTASMIMRVIQSKTFKIEQRLYDTYDNKNFTPEENEISPVENTKFKINLRNKPYQFITRIAPAALNHLATIWESTNPNVLEIDKYSGEAHTHFSGTTKVTARVGNKTQTMDVEVVNESGECVVTGLSNSGAVRRIEGKTKEVYVENATGAEIENGKIIESISNTQHIVEPDSTTELKVKKNKYKYKDIIAEATIASGVQNGDVIYHKKETTMKYNLHSNAKISDIEFNVDGEWTKGETIDVALGDKEKKIVARYKINGIEKTTEAIIKPIENVSTLYYKTESMSYGKEKTRTYMDKVYNTQMEEEDFSHKAEIVTLDNKYDECDSKEIEYQNKTGNFNNEKNVITKIEADEELKELILKAYWKYTKFFFVESSEYRINVSHGININNEKELAHAQSKNKKVAIQKDIFIQGEEYLNNYMYTTYDWKYYKNIHESRPKIQYLLEFTNSVYGNGFQINADKITTGKMTKFGEAPSFVAAKNGLFKVSLRGQDNICFLVRKGNIELRNVVLKACKDESLIHNNKFSQKELENKGTVLEIMGDNVNVLNSRVSNGRTCIRIFGRDLNQDPEFNSVVEESEMSSVDVEKEKIKVGIINSVISNAREFLIKIGSNRAVRATDSTEKSAKGNLLPKTYRFKKNNGTDYLYRDKNSIDDYFKKHYVVTEVTLENNELRSSGLFAIGMDTHFAGKLLWNDDDDFGAIPDKSWRNIAATSYAAELNIKGDLKIYNWVDLSTLDASSLIEISGSLSGGLGFLRLDFQGMIKAVIEREKYNDIIYKIKQKQFIHGGIAFFGGGENYSYLNEDSGELANMRKMFVNLSQVAGKDKLTKLVAEKMPDAAGHADFIFYLYKTDSQRNYNWQYA